MSFHHISCRVPLCLMSQGKDWVLAPELQQAAKRKGLQFGFAGESEFGGPARPIEVRADPLHPTVTTIPSYTPH
jgi:hypothetical protein